MAVDLGGQVHIMAKVMKLKEIYVTDETTMFIDSKSTYFCVYPKI